MDWQDKLKGMVNPKPTNQTEASKTTEPQKANVEQKEPKRQPPKPNIGWLFYKDYFNTLTDEDYQIVSLTKEEKKHRENEVKAIEEKMSKKISHITSQSFNTQKPLNLGNANFELKTTYPGLLIGSGYGHEIPDIKGQAILGFHFDYTTGLPVIPGSSLKGALRSAFEHPDYICELLEQNIDVKKLETEIFDNSDIFFDAIIVKGDKQNKILGDDYITPHKEATKNPIPLRFIKVLPDVTFRFSFQLSGGTITAEQKQKLFKSIILDLGLGAKTNVGYGKFTE
jgi:CRISPR-associated protein Cmr6